MKNKLFKVGLLVLLFGVLMQIHQYIRKVPMNPGYPVMQVNPKSLNNVKRFIVLISNEGLMGVSRGTGLIIDKDHVLTCGHLMPQEDQIMMIYTYPMGQVLTGKVQYAENGTDLALIKLSRPVKLPFYPRFQNHVEEGEPLVVIGNILGSMRWFVSYGTECGTDFGYILTDALIHGGNSGGPWFNYRGEVVAITDWGLEIGGKEAGISGGVSALTIQKFLQHSKHPNLLQMLFGGLN